jgi:hypothetical protein
MADATIPPPRYSLWQAINVAITLGMRAIEEVRALARDGGKPGPPGLGFDDFDIEFDGRRTFVFRLAREGLAPKVKSFTIPAQIYRGVYKEGERYDRGDTATWGGSLYHCNESTTDKPGVGSAAWTLAVKRGQDGKDGKQGAKGEPGIEGKAGRDLTQMGPRGERW